MPRAGGHGGIARVARAAGVSRPTIYRGLTDLARPSPANRVRLGGGGRKRLTDTDPTLVADLEELEAQLTRGDLVERIGQIVRAKRS